MTQLIRYTLLLLLFVGITTFSKVHHRWDPFVDFNDVFDYAPSQHVDLATDVTEEEHSITITMHVPEINPDAIEIDVQNNYVLIRGAREEKKEEKKERYYRKEIRRGVFERVIQLPAPVVAESAEATYEDGVLTITFSKRKKSDSMKKITVKRK